MSRSVIKVQTEKQVCILKREFFQSNFLTVELLFGKRSRHHKSVRFDWPTFAILAYMQVNPVQLTLSRYFLKIIYHFPPPSSNAFLLRKMRKYTNTFF